VVGKEVLDRSIIERQIPPLTLLAEDFGVHLAAGGANANLVTDAPQERFINQFVRIEIRAEDDE